MLYHTTIAVAQVLRMQGDTLFAAAGAIAVHACLAVASVVALRRYDMLVSPMAKTPAGAVDAELVPPSPTLAGDVSYEVRHDTTHLAEPFVTVTPHASSVRGDGHIGAPRPSVGCVSHVAVATSDVPRLLAFYTKTLGFRELARPPFPFGGAWVEAGGFVLHIIASDPEVPRGRLEGVDWERERYGIRRGDAQPWYIRRGRHMAFHVSDLAAWEVALIHHGVRYTKFVVPGGGKRQQLFLFDPDGNGIELTEA
jgi:catechol 2,3-dioxygenase-like lactoylglutathione lyase family enzyme